MKIIIIDNESVHIDSFTQVLPGHEIVIIPWKYVAKEYSRIKKSQLIILSGSSIHAVLGETGKEVYDTQRDLLKNLSVPILGICAGFQLIAEVFGSELMVLKKEERITGIQESHILTDHELFQGMETLHVYKYHRWVVKTVPDVLIAHAKNDLGYDILQHKDKNIWGFQFHPEVTNPENDGLSLLHNYIKVLQKGGTI